MSTIEKVVVVAAISGVVALGALVAFAPKHKPAAEACREMCAPRLVHALSAFGSCECEPK